MVQVDDCAFAFCKKLTRFTIPGVVERLGNTIFLGCEQLQSIVIKHHDAEMLQALTDYYLTETPLGELKEKVQIEKPTQWK